MPSNVELFVDAPATVQEGQDFTIVVRVKNTAPETQTFVDLDIADEYLEGIVIKSTQPAFSDAMHVPIDNTVSYSLGLPVPAGKEVKVTLRAAAVRSGDFSGDFDFCINSEITCLPYPVRTVVR
jgi:hypothetical protein